MWCRATFSPTEAINLLGPPAQQPSAQVLGVRHQRPRPPGRGPLSAAPAATENHLTVLQLRAPGTQTGAPKPRGVACINKRRTSAEVGICSAPARAHAIQDRLQTRRPPLHARSPLARSHVLTTARPVRSRHTALPLRVRAQLSATGLTPAMPHALPVSTSG